MKHLKKYLENIQYSDIMNDLIDMSLELSDIGFGVWVKEIGDLYLIVLLNHQDMQIDQCNEFILRCRNYLGSFGFKLKLYGIGNSFEIKIIDDKLYSNDKLLTHILSGYYINIYARKSFIGFDRNNLFTYYNRIQGSYYQNINTTE